MKKRKPKTKGKGKQQMQKREKEAKELIKKRVLNEKNRFMLKMKDLRNERDFVCHMKLMLACEERERSGGRVDTRNKRRMGKK